MHPWHDMHRAVTARKSDEFRETWKEIKVGNEREIRGNWEARMSESEQVKTFQFGSI
jgi:hypothetical protein